MPEPQPVDDPELLQALSGERLPLHFKDGEGAVLARCRREEFVALLVVYEFERDEDDDSYPFEQEVMTFSRDRLGVFAHESAGGTDWRLGLDRLPLGVPPWLSGFLSSNRFGCFATGAVSDLGDLSLLTTFGADAVPPVEDAPTGAFIIRFRNGQLALREWDAQLRRPETHQW